VTSSPTIHSTTVEPAATETDYRRRLVVDAPLEAVVSALTSTEGISAWWSTTRGDPSAGGVFRVSHAHVRPMVFAVREGGPDTVSWDVLAAPLTPEWDSTRITFDLHPAPLGTVIDFQHHGLAPDLDCFQMCRAGWDHVLASLQQFLETGTGRPTTFAPHQEAWMSTPVMVIQRDIYIDAPVEVVWRVVTEPELISQWFADRVDVAVAPGAQGSMTFDGHDGPDQVSQVLVESVDPLRSWAYRWGHETGQPAGPGNSTLVRFTLSPEGEGTRLRVVETELELTDWDHDVVVREHNAGWETCLGRAKGVAESARR
jgi:uncharacterized protein YndB with AHSA1/START domain